jgi:hypothetical protein
MLTPAIKRRTIGSLEVVSLFGYSVLEPFILTKHTPIGHRVYWQLGREFLRPFLVSFLENMEEGELPPHLIGVVGMLKSAVPPLKFFKVSHVCSGSV